MHEQASNRHMMPPTRAPTLHSSAVWPDWPHSSQRATCWKVTWHKVSASRKKSSHSEPNIKETKKSKKKERKETEKKDTGGERNNKDLLAQDGEMRLVGGLTGQGWEKRRSSGKETDETE